MTPKYVEQAGVRPWDATMNRRMHRRVETRVRLTIAYVAEGEFLMDDGYITNLSKDGMGVQGTRPLRSGMAVSLFVARPESEDDLCIPQAQVSWSAGCRFGLVLNNLNPKAETELLECLAHRL